MKVYTEAKFNVKISETEDVDMSPEQLDRRIKEVKDTLAQEFANGLMEDGWAEYCEAELVDFKTQIISE